MPSTENIGSYKVASYITFCSLVDDHDEVAMYHQQTNKSQQTIEQTNVTQEVVSREVSKLNHTADNEQKTKSNAFFIRKNVKEKENG